MNSRKEWARNRYLLNSEEAVDTTLKENVDVWWNFCLEEVRSIISGVCGLGKGCRPPNDAD